jgi:hypothetical protein
VVGLYYPEYFETWRFLAVSSRQERRVANGGNVGRGGRTQCEGSRFRERRLLLYHERKSIRRFSEGWWDVFAHAAVPRFLVWSAKAASVWRDYRGVICIAL